MTVHELSISMGRPLTTRSGWHFIYHRDFVCILDAGDLGKVQNCIEWGYPSELFMHENGIRIDVSVEVLSSTIERVTCQLIQ